MATQSAAPSRARSAAKTKAVKAAKAEIAGAPAEVIVAEPADDEATMFKRAQLNHAFEIARLSRDVAEIKAALGLDPDAALKPGAIKAAKARRK